MKAGDFLDTVTILGTRGSIPRAGQEFTRYGGDTICVLVELAGETILLDAGTGLLNCDIPGGTAGVPWWTDFGINVNTNGYGNKDDANFRWNKITRLKKASSRGNVSEIAWYRPLDKQTKNSVGPYWALSAGISDRTNSIVPRHNREFNLSFHDGHVGRLNIRDLPAGSAHKIYSNAYYEQGDGGIANNEVPFPF